MSMSLKISDLDFPNMVLENHVAHGDYPTWTLQFDVEREDSCGGFRDNGCVSARLKKAGVTIEWEDSCIGDFHDAFKKVVEDGGREETDAFVIELTEHGGVSVTHKVKMLGREEFNVGMTIHVAREILDTFGDWISELGD